MPPMEARGTAALLCFPIVRPDGAWALLMRTLPDGEWRLDENPGWAPYDPDEAG